MDSVWIVQAGWDFEGVAIKGVYSTYEDAVHCKESLPKKTCLAYDNIYITEFKVNAAV